MDIFHTFVYVSTYLHGATYIKVLICRVQLTSPLRSEQSETQDKQVKAANSQNNTENNIVNKIESSSDEEDDNKSDLQMHDTPIGNRKNHPYPTIVIKPNQIIKFKDLNDIVCINWQIQVIELNDIECIKCRQWQIQVLLQ